MKDYEHLIRVGVVFLCAIALFLTARHFLTPASYGELGRYRAASVTEIKALPVKYAGKRAQKECSACHEKEYKEKMGGPHKGINCETCHGPLARHVEDPSSLSPSKPSEAMVVKFCVRCHSRSVARPVKHPQIDPLKHNAGTACTSCHQPHSPRL